MILIALFGTLPDGKPDFNRRYWLAGDPVRPVNEHTPLASEQRAINRQSFNHTGPGWAYELPQDGQNEALRMTFTTDLLFASAIEAWRWRNRFSQADASTWPHPIEGDALMRFVLPDGTHEDVRLHHVLISKPQMTPEHETLSLAYTLKGGQISPLTSGLTTAMPLALVDEIDGLICARLFGTGVGGPFADARTIQSGGSLTTALNAGATFGLILTDTLTGTFTERHFALVGNLGDPVPAGHTPLLAPLHEHLTDLAAALTDIPGLSVFAVDDTRDHLVFVWTPSASDPDPTETSLIFQAETLPGAGVREFVTNAADSVPLTLPSPVLMLPADDAGQVPAADALPV